MLSRPSALNSIEIVRGAHFPSTKAVKMKKAPINNTRRRTTMAEIMGGNRGGNVCSSWSSNLNVPLADIKEKESFELTDVCLYVNSKFHISKITGLQFHTKHLAREMFLLFIFKSN